MEAFPRYFLERPTAAEACPKQLGMPVRPCLVCSPGGAQPEAGTGHGEQ